MMASEMWHRRRSCTMGVFRLIMRLLAMGAVWSAAALGEEPPPIRLSVHCIADGRPSAEIQDRVIAALSKEPQIEVMERARIDLLLKESETTPERRLQLGHFLALDYFLNLRQTGEAMPEKTAWSIEAVNAQSGELVAGCSVTVKNGDDPVESLSMGIAKLARRSLVGKLTAQNRNESSPRVAVLDFLPPGSDNPRETGQALRLSADVRTFLTGGGMTVLDRALAQQVVRENSYRQEGFTETPSPRLPLMGADLVVTGKLDHAGKEWTLQMTLLSAKESRVIAAKHFSYNPGKEAGSLPEEARQWLVETLHPARSAERTFEETIQIEALEPFYQGIAKFCAGQYMDAADEFQKAYTTNEKFGDAMLMEARCYDALGLRPLAEAERRFVKIGIVDRGAASSGKACPGDAVTFLGITGADSPDERLLAETVEMLAIDQLARQETRLQLASHLASLRDEYDVLVGTENARGTRWTDTPSFFSSRSVRGEMTPPDGNGAHNIAWLLVDTLSGRTLSQTTTVLDKNSANWKKQIASGIADLLKTSRAEAPCFPSPSTPPPPVADLEKKLSGGNGITVNKPLLQMALADPNHQLLAAHALAKGAAGRSELDAFFNFALRDYLIGKMSAENPVRPWLELQRIASFLRCDQTGPYLSGTTLDPSSALVDFVAAHPNDLPGCFAEYMLLYDQLGARAPDALAQQLLRLETRLGNFPDTELEGLRELRGMTRALRITAQIATGKDSVETLPTGIFAQRMRIEFDRLGKPVLRKKWPTWFTNSWEIFSGTVGNRVEEARASLAILGRGDDLRRVDPRWLDDYPNSYEMMMYVIDGLHEVNWNYGKPFFYEFNAAAEREKFHKMTTFAHRNLLKYIDSAADQREAAYFEDLADQFVQNLTEPAFSNTVTDQEWEKMRQELRERMDAANTRIGRKGTFVSRRYASDWRLMSRRPPGDNAPDRESILDRERPERVRLRQEEQRVGDSAWQTSPTTERRWTDFVHSGPFERQFNAREKAQIYLRYLPRLNAIYPGPDLSSAELCLFQDFGMTLLQGGETAASEAVFARMLEAELNDLNSFGSAMELRANAALNLAWSYRASGRKAEALECARRALEMSIQSGRFFHILQRMNWHESHAGLNEKNDNVDSNLRAIALRLIAELRNEGKEIPLPPRLKTVVVHTPNMTNAEVTFYYRLPEKYDPAKPPPVLLLCPSRSEGALNYCLDGSPWVQFADKEGIVLCAPQFGDEHRGADFPAFVGYQVAHSWSGKATLDALEKIRAQSNIDTKRLLMYGYGGGCQFVQHFSRFAPERCAALAMHSAQNWLWKEGCERADMLPLSSVKNIPCLVTTGAEDNYGCDEFNRLATAVQWVTMARGEGVPVLWKSWPGIAHQHASELDQMCMAFFDNVLHPSGGPPAFIGDLRTWRYYPAGDARIREIPDTFQQPLPTQELAELWGSPIQ